MFSKVKIAVLATTLALIPATAAQATDFGSATSYGAAAQSGITGSGSIKPNAASIANSISPSVAGTKSINNTKAVNVLTDAGKVASAADGMRKSNVKTGTSLTGTYAAGTYYWEDSMVSQGDVTISGSGDHTFVVENTAIFKAGTKFNFVNGASVCNTVFLLKNAVKIETNTVLGGSFIASIKSIDQDSGSTVTGRLISLQQSVNLNGTSNVSTCVPTPPVTPPVTPPSTPTPQPQPPAPTPPSTPTPQPQVTPAPQPTPENTPEPRIPGNGTVKSPKCMKKSTFLKVVISGQQIKSAKLGSSKVTISKSKKSATIKVDTRLFRKSTKRTIKVNFTDGTSKTFKVKLKKCRKAGVTKRTPKVTG